MILRPATPKDTDAICAIWNPVIRDTEITFNAIEKTSQDIADLVGDKHRAGHGFLVAAQEGVIAGFAFYGQFRGGVGYARTMEHTVVLATGARGTGIGRALMGGIEDHARKEGAHSMFAGVSSGNPGGVGFHAALGYHHVATLPEVGFKFGRWFDLHLMQKKL